MSHDVGIALFRFFILDLGCFSSVRGDRRGADDVTGAHEIHIADGKPLDGARSQGVGIWGRAI